MVERLAEVEATPALMATNGVGATVMVDCLVIEELGYEITEEAAAKVLKE